MGSLKRPPKDECGISAKTFSDKITLIKQDEDLVKGRE